jgi:hypothetical protein
MSVWAEGSGPGSRPILGFCLSNVKLSSFSARDLVIMWMLGKRL